LLELNDSGKKASVGTSLRRNIYFQFPPKNPCFLKSRPYITVVWSSELRGAPNKSTGHIPKEDQMERFLKRLQQYLDAINEVIKGLHLVLFNLAGLLNWIILLVISVYLAWLLFEEILARVS